MISIVRGLVAATRELTLTICCPHLAGEFPGSPTLAFSEGAPHAWLDLKGLRNWPEKGIEVFEWIKQKARGVDSAHINVLCCTECAHSEVMDLDDCLHETFEKRCVAIECFLPYLFKKCGKLTCIAGTMKASDHKGDVSGIRPVLRILRRKAFTYEVATDATST